MADEMAPQQPNLVEQYAQSVNQRKLEAEAQMQKLIDSLNVRKNLPFDPILMGYARGVLSPTKTGSFGESLGYGLGAASEEAQKQATQEVERAKMEFELRQKQQEQKNAADAIKFRMQYFGGKPAAPAAPAAAPTAVPAAPRLTAAPAIEAQQLTATPQMSTPAFPALLPEDMPKAPPPVAASAVAPSAPTAYQPQFPPKDLAMLGIVDPTSLDIALKVEEQARKQAELAAKEREARAKELEQELKQNSVNVFGTTIPFTKEQRAAIEEGIRTNDVSALDEIFMLKGIQSPYVLRDGKVKVLPQEEWTARQKAAETLGMVKRTIRGKDYEMTAPEALEHDAAKRAGRDKYKSWVNNFFEQGSDLYTEPAPSAAPSAAAPSTGAPAKAAPAKVEPPPSLGEREVSQEVAKTRGRKQAEETINFETTLTETAKQAGNLRRTANTILSLINDEKYSGAQGYFAQPGLKNAIATFLEEGFQFGNSRVALPGLTEAFKKIGMTPPEAEAEAILFQKTGELGLLISKLQAGQGSVSNYERSVFEKIATSTKTPLIAMRSAMNALRARAVYDENIQKVYVDWSEKNPNKSSAAFIASPEYKRETARYEKQLGMIEDQFFPKTKAAQPAAKPEAKPEGKPSSKFLQ